MPGTYFVTSRTWESRPLFAKKTACDTFVDSLLHYRDQAAYQIHSFVLMPDHFHLLLTPGSDVALERAVQYLKGGSAKRIGETLRFLLPVWQRGYSDHRIRDARDFEAHVRYIEQNPVKKRLVLAAPEYPWSSACGRFAMDKPPLPLALAAKATGKFDGALSGTSEDVP